MKKSSVFQPVFILFVFFTAILTTLSFGQQSQKKESKIIVEPSDIKLKVDEEVQLQAKVVNARGEATQDTVFFYSRSRSSVAVTPEGRLKAIKPGEFQLIAVAVGPQDEQLRKTINVTIAYPPVKEITFLNMPENIYTSTTLPVEYEVRDAKDMLRDNVEVTLTSSNPGAVEVDDFGRLKAKKPGSFTLTAEAEGVRTTWTTKVTANPVTSVKLESSAVRARTGDVIAFNGEPRTFGGDVVDDAPVTYSIVSEPDDNLGGGPSGQIEQDGRFVANKPGLFTIMAKSGTAVAEETVRINQRNVQKDIQITGHGLISDVHTSDLWVWEGVDGRDYAVTGTWGANGEAYFWDVTNPAAMHIIDTVRVDARTVNDVKVSDDGRIGVITREGASDRKNGIVILDVSNPSDVKILSEYNQGLTGGVHNAFIYKNHVFAVNNGRRYDIIDITDPKNPQTVSRFELNTPGHAIHDVWVENGIAYSSNWNDGIVAVDVGSTPAAQSPERHDIGAGSLENPVKLGSYAYPSGWNHAAFPFKSESTGDFYVIGGDEAFPNGINIDNKPTVPAGWMHFIKFENDWNSPKEVARYEVPEAGTHNMWVKGDTLYVAYYNAGLRIVDISGDLMGNMYEQGREIAKLVPTHHQGRVPNAPMAWGPQPHKGYIFVSDWNSGLWAFKLVEEPQGTN